MSRLTLSACQTKLKFSTRIACSRGSPKSDVCGTKCDDGKHLMGVGCVLLQPLTEAEGLTGLGSHRSLGKIQQALNLANTNKTTGNLYVLK